MHYTVCEEEAVNSNDSAGLRGTVFRSNRAIRGYRTGKHSLLC